MNRFLSLAALLIAVFPFSISAEESENLFSDPVWENGFQVTRGADLIGILQFEKRDQNPAWILAEHNSKFNLAESEQVPVPGGIKAETPGNLVQIVSDETGNRVLRLGVFAENEYAKPRTAAEGWPHLLIVQNWVGKESIRLKEDSPLIFSADLRVAEAESKMSDSEYDPGLHCAQATAYFIFRPSDPDSPDRNDFVWVGIPVFDSRYPFPPPYVNLDINPDLQDAGKLIWVPGGTETLDSLYGGKNPRFGEWVHLEADLNQYKKNVLADAQKRNFLTHTKPDELEIGHFNLGWEVPGTFRAVLEIKNLKLVRKEDNE